MVEEDFYSQLKNRIQTHDFKPIIIPVKKMKSRAYEKTEKAKKKHKEWRESPSGKASCSRASIKYAKSHPEVRKAIGKRFYENHKEEIAAKRKQKRLEDPEGTRKKRNSMPSSQPEYVNAYMRAYRARKKAEKDAQKNISEKTPNEP